MLRRGIPPPPTQSCKSKSRNYRRKMVLSAKSGTRGTVAWAAAVTGLGAGVARGLEALEGLRGAMVGQGRWRVQRRRGTGCGPPEGRALDGGRGPATAPAHVTEAPP